MVLVSLLLLLLLLLLQAWTPGERQRLHRPLLFFSPHRAVAGSVACAVVFVLLRLSVNRTGSGVKGFSPRRPVD
jgi:hypothetical protein